MNKKKQHLREMMAFINEKGLMNRLCEKANVSRNTVVATFEAESFEDLKGKQLIVYQAAIELMEQIKQLPAKAEELLKM